MLLIAECSRSAWVRGGFLNKKCITARCSVRLISAPANIASRCCSRAHCRASSSSNSWVASSIRFLDRSAKTCGASWLKQAKRLESSAKALRKSKFLPEASNKACSAAHAGVWSQRNGFMGRFLGGQHQLFKLDGVSRKHAYAFGQLL